jgi:hypothetical protein
MSALVVGLPVLLGFGLVLLGLVHLASRTYD